MMRSSALLAALVLAGCAVGPDFQAPPAPSATGYTAPGEETPAHLALGQKAAGDWWTLFHSPKLDAAVRLALSGNRDLAASEATLAAVQEQVAAATGNLYPHLGLSGGVSRQKQNLSTFGFKVPPPIFNLYSLGTSVSYSLDVFGGTRRQLESVEAEALAEAHRLSAAYLTIAGNVATQAIAIASFRAQLHVLEDIAASDEKNLELVRMAAARGLVPNLDVLSAQSQLAADRALLPPVRQQLSAAGHALAVLMGKAPAEWPAPEFDLTDFTLPETLPVSLPSALVHERPDILAAEATLRAASARVGVATARAYPSITLSASIAQAAFMPGHLFTSAFGGWSGGAGVLAPIFEGGSIEAGRRGAVAAYNAAVATYEQTVIQGFAQTADRLQALLHDRQELEEQGKAQGYAKSVLDLSRQSFGAGQTGILQVLESERQYGHARLGQARAQAQTYTDTVQLFVATGAGWKAEAATDR